MGASTVRKRVLKLMAATLDPIAIELPIFPNLKKC